MLQLAQYKLLNCGAFVIILSFLEEWRALEFQLLSRKFYDFHVPWAMKAVTFPEIKSTILSRPQRCMMQTLFDKKVALILLYVGSRYDFSAKKFHQLCDDKGVTVSVCKSEHGNVFGFFTSVPWKSSGGGKPVDGEAFFFKFEGDKGV